MTSPAADDRADDTAEDTAESTDESVGNPAAATPGPQLQVMSPAYRESVARTLDAANGAAVVAARAGFANMTKPSNDVLARLAEMSRQRNASLERLAQVNHPTNNVLAQLAEMSRQRNASLGRLIQVNQSSNNGLARLVEMNRQRNANLGRLVQVNQSSNNVLAHLAEISRQHKANVGRLAQVNQPTSNVLARLAEMSHQRGETWGRFAQVSQPYHEVGERLATQLTARQGMIKILDEAGPGLAASAALAEVTALSAKLLKAYGAWVTSHESVAWTTYTVDRVTSRGFTVDGLIAADSLTMLEPDTTEYGDLADVVEEEVLPPWQEARLDLILGFEARLAAIDPKMAELYRAACAARGRAGQDGFLEEACTGLYELLVRLFREHIAPDEKLVEYEKANPGVKLRNKQERFTHSARVRYATLAHRSGSDRDLFSATVDGLSKMYDALISKASKGRHQSVGDATTLSSMLMATESTLSQVLDLYEFQQSNPLQG